MTIRPIDSDPFGIMMMNSHEKTDKLLKDMIDAVNHGYNPNVVFDDVLAQNGIREEDLMEWDKKRLKKKVEEAYRAKNR